MVLYYGDGIYVFISDLNMKFLDSVFGMFHELVD